jgi:hypothetical protein
MNCTKCGLEITTRDGMHGFEARLCCDCQDRLQPQTASASVYDFYVLKYECFVPKAEDVHAALIRAGMHSKRQLDRIRRKAKRGEG